MPRALRLNGQRFFLTYSQAADISLDAIADHLAELANFDFLEIVQENHQDAGIHYHVVLCFEPRIQLPFTAFDVDGHHPNFVAIKNATTELYNRRHYIRKGAERRKEDEHLPKSHKQTPCDYTVEPESRGEVPPYVESTGRLNWGGILAAAESKEDFLILVRQHQPKDWVLRNDSITRYADSYYKKAAEPEKVYPADSWILPPAVDQWVQEVFADVSIFIPARSHVPPLTDYSLIITIG
nr:MAG TPA: Geminivirus Rep catalytic domain [Cressdnaviricota sp.]